MKKGTCNAGIHIIIVVQASAGEGKVSETVPDSTDACIISVRFII